MSGVRNYGLALLSFIRPILSKLTKDFTGAICSVRLILIQFLNVRKLSRGRENGSEFFRFSDLRLQVRRLDYTPVILIILAILQLFIIFGAFYLCGCPSSGKEK